MILSELVGSARSSAAHIFLRKSHHLVIQQKARSFFLRMKCFHRYESQITIFSARASYEIVSWLLNLCLSFFIFRIFEINFSILNFDFSRFDIEILICCIIHIMSQSINFFNERHSALIFSAFSEDEVFSSSKRFEFFDFFEIFDRAIFFSLNSIYSMILNYLIENLSRICFIALAHFSEFLISKDSNHRGKRCRVFSVSEFQATSDKSDLRLVIDEIVKSRCVCPCR